MKMPALLFFVLMCLSSLLQQATAQPAGCILKDPVVHIDFGRSSNVTDFNTASLPNYNRIDGACPTDGHYTYTPASYDCFAGDWFSLAQDHTPGDIDGNMLLVNAAPSGGVFFSRAISGFTGGRTYEWGTWIINVCRLHICCSSLSPNISVLLSTPGGKKLAAFRIGDLPQRTAPQWRKFVGFFTVPAGERTVLLTMFNNTVGGCGNDFAIDDITFRECVPQQPAIAATPKKPATQPAAKKQTPAPKLVSKQETTAKPAVKPVLIATPPAEKVKAAPAKALPAPEARLATTVPVPPVLRTRANPLIRQFETGAGELQVDLYDNGQIDGDTVSVYHNNKLVVSQARLTQTPIRLRIQVNDTDPYHELVMVAHNLGSIPPNTSLMIVTAGEKKYQVNITSSEQQNAKVVFRLQE